MVVKWELRRDLFLFLVLLMQILDALLSPMRRLFQSFERLKGRLDLTRIRVHISRFENDRGAVEANRTASECKFMNI